MLLRVTQLAFLILLCSSKIQTDRFEMTASLSSDDQVRLSLTAPLGTSIELLFNEGTEKWILNSDDTIDDYVLSPSKNEWIELPESLFWVEETLEMDAYRTVRVNRPISQGKTNILYSLISSDGKVKETGRALLTASNSIASVEADDPDARPEWQNKFYAHGTWLYVGWGLLSFCMIVTGRYFKQFRLI